MEIYQRGSNVWNSMDYKLIFFLKSWIIWSQQSWVLIFFVLFFSSKRKILLHLISKFRVHFVFMIILSGGVVKFFWFGLSLSPLMTLSNRIKSSLIELSFLNRMTFCRKSISSLLHINKWFENRIISSMIHYIIVQYSTVQFSTVFHPSINPSIKKSFKVNCNWIYFVDFNSQNFNKIAA